MIQIDLGKDELQKTPSKAKAFNFNTAIIKSVLQFTRSQKKQEQGEEGGTFRRMFRAFF